MDTGTGAITAIHLTLLVILVGLAIGAIVWGARLKRARVAAEQEFKRNEAETRDATAQAQADLGMDPVPRDHAPTAPLPVAPAPPPIVDEAAPGTPAPRPLADEPIAAAAPMAASMASEDAPESAAPAAAAISAERPVTILKGLGPKVAAALAERGITTVGQIAALDDTRADALDADLGAFRGRMARDRWIEQARFLAAGDDEGFEAVFGRL